jgi:tryptophan synthase alpha chain
MSAPEAVQKAQARTEFGFLESTLREHRASGRKLLVPYVMAGMVEDWVDVLQAVVAAGADAIEVGIPFSDPMMDGPVIQAAALASLERATTPQGVLDAIRGAGLGVPDLSLEELGPWAEEADAAGVETVLLVAPSSPPNRVRAICERSRGFVYAVAQMGVTGERTKVSDDVSPVVNEIRRHTDAPVCVGVGVSTPEQAAEVCAVADGVVVGSALVRRLLEGEGPEGAASFVGDLRRAMDAASG